MRLIRRRLALSVVAGVILTGFALALRQSDPASPPVWLPQCSFNVTTGLYCPGCGNTRVAYALLHGDVARAFRQNVLFVISLPFLAFLAWRSWINWIAPGWQRPLSIRWRQSYTWGIVAILMIYWVIRNLPWEPFSYLAPVP